MCTGPSDVNETQGKDPQGDIQSCIVLNQDDLLKFSLLPFTHSSAFLLFASCHGDLPRNEPENNQTKKKGNQEFNEFVLSFGGNLRSERAVCR